MQKLSEFFFYPVCGAGAPLSSDSVWLKWGPLGHIWSQRHLYSAVSHKLSRNATAALVVNLGITLTRASRQSSE